MPLQLESSVKGGMVLVPSGHVIELQNQNGKPMAFIHSLTENVSGLQVWPRAGNPGALQEGLSRARSHLVAEGPGEIYKLRLRRGMQLPERED